MAHINKFLRELGRGGPEVPALGYGTMGQTFLYGRRVSDGENIAILKRAVDLGCSLIDSSDVYGLGNSEELIGEALKDPTFKGKAFVATKFGLAAGAAGFEIKGTKEYVRRSCEASLMRLGVETIDLYYQHRVDRSIAIEETWNELKMLRQEGKVRHLGICEATPEEIRKAHAVTPISVYQVEFSPWTTDIKFNGIYDTCKELGIAVVAYSPLGRGFLTGSIKGPDDFEADDYRRSLPRFQGEAFYENLKIVESLKRLAESKRCTVGQLTLRWVLEQVDFAIPGTTKEKNLLENVGSLKVELSSEDLKAVEDAIRNVGVVGHRYGDGTTAHGF
ncbi:Aldo/keto reductase [Atractiella rhizophila]|nr:Aldo/keto reductase [Atractiella rhizophila]